MRRTYLKSPYKECGILSGRNSRKKKPRRKSGLPTRKEISRTRGKDSWLDVYRRRKRACADMGCSCKNRL